MWTCLWSQLCLSIVSMLVVSPSIVGDACAEPHKDLSVLIAKDKEIARHKFQELVDSVAGQGVLSYYTSERAIRFFVHAYTGEDSVDGILSYLKQFAGILTRGEIMRMGVLLFQGYRAENFKIEGHHVPEIISEPNPTKMLMTLEDMKEFTPPPIQPTKNTEKSK